jgi:hypothetical protein
MDTEEGHGGEKEEEERGGQPSAAGLRPLYGCGPTVVWCGGRTYRRLMWR